MSTPKLWGYRPAQSPATDGSGLDFDRLCQRAALAMVAAVALASVALAIFPMSANRFTQYLFVRQDFIWILIAAAFVIALPGLSRWSGLIWAERLQTLATPRAIMGIAAIALIVTFAGSYTITLDHALSRDEILANFDAAIFRRGQLLAPVPEAWRAYDLALAPDYTLFTAGSTHWASLYLPVNAAIRTVFASIATANLANPVLLAVAIAAVYALAREVWPDRPDAALVAVLMLVTSTQVLAMAMTSYAMTGHLALNTVWVWLYRRGTWRGFCGALVIGACALGLHQLIFHVLFVAPFMLMLVWQRKWTLAAVFAAGYGAACLFWIKYWQFAAAMTGVDLQPGLGGGLAYLYERVAALFTDRTPDGTMLMALNAVRFVAWQSPLLVVFVAAAIMSGKAIKDATLRALLAGAALSVVAMWVLLPYQGLGWGYRYLHGSVGGLALVAAAGWVHLFPAVQDGTRWRPLAAGLVLFVVAALPVQMTMVRNFIAPYAAATQVIRSTQADVVIIETGAFVFSPDLVQNAPWFDKRPLTMSLHHMRRSKQIELCGQARVAIFTSEAAAAYGFVPAGGDDAAATRARVAELKAAGCNLEVASPRR